MLSQDLQSRIQLYFKECVKARSLVLRSGQRVMIAEVARNFAESVDLDINSESNAGKICVIEAGTGTGKTLAYTLGALPVAMEYEKPLVISTATVALQEQLINKDLPEIRANTSLDFEFALVKGRARYMCLSKLLLWEKQDGEGQGFFFEDMLLDEQSMSVNAEDLALYQKMITAWDDGDWDGERDHWPEELNQRSWAAVMANRQDCSGKKCPHYSQCSFFEARKKIAEADLIVTNHDLVMADFFQDEGNILPPIEDAFYVFDEAHHLPDKALSHYASSFRVQASKTWLLRSQSLLDKLQDEEFFELLPQSDFRKCHELILQLQEQLEELFELVEEIYQSQFADKLEARSQYQEDRIYCRFPYGELPEVLQDKSIALNTWFGKLRIAAYGLLEVMKTHSEHDEQESLMAYITAIAGLMERAEQSANLFSYYARKGSGGASEKREGLARWISLHEFGDIRDFQLSASPIHASEVLKELVWEPCLAVLLTSATLTALGKFDFFIERSGLPDHASFFRIESPFDFVNSAKLVLPDFKAEPGQSPDFAIEVANYLEKWQPLSMGTLVLFSSWAQMNEVSDFIDSKYHDAILKQGDLSKEEIIRIHKDRIDQHQHSMIFGLASFAEGIDLPGDYLSHVIICKIPFSVPTDPMAEALSEWVTMQGRNPFQSISVPEASLKLIQACGRLLRSEKDSGRISILDKRLKSKSYGKQLLSALPPYTVQFGDE